MGILGNEAADVFAKQAAEGVPLDDHERDRVYRGRRRGGGYHFFLFITHVQD